MDIVLEIFDTFVFDRLYASVLPLNPGNGLMAAGNVTAEPWNLGLATSERYGLEKTFLLEPSAYANMSSIGRGNVLRQALSLFVVTSIFGWVLYLSTAYLSYRFVYDHENFKHPKYLKNQMAMEIKQAVSAIPVMTALTVPWFVMEVQGKANLYWNIEDYGWWYLALQFPMFLIFTDALIYCIHRFLHHPMVYKHLHKPHHKWIVPTPFASHAFHPVDGYLQSLPYHIFPFLFPMHKIAYVVLFMIVNVWTVMIHDGEYMANDPVINGSACHTIHHVYFNYNYGQYTTLWDRLGGSYREPDAELFKKETKMAKSTWDKQVKQMEEIRKEVEGDDDTRVYASGNKSATTATKR